MRTRRAVHQTRLAFGGEPADPLVHALARETHRRSDVRFLPAGAKPLHDQQSALVGGAGITVGHENLRVGDGPSTSHTPLGGSPHFKPTRLSPTSCLSTSSRRDLTRCCDAAMRLMGGRPPRGSGWSNVVSA